MTTDEILMSLPKVIQGGSLKLQYQAGTWIATYNYSRGLWSDGETPNEAVTNLRNKLIELRYIK